MATPRVDVNDAELRESFLRHESRRALNALGDESPALWGQMRPQEMIEHLTWAFRLSTGQAHTECFVPAAELPRMRRFLYSNRPTPRDFMNPALRAGRPPLHFANLTDAKAGLNLELGRFLNAPRTSEHLHTHPIFGPIEYDEWHRAHYKHVHHHLLQFGLIESE